MKPKPESEPGGIRTPAESRREDEDIRGGSRTHSNVSSTRMHRAANGTRPCNDISMPAPNAVPLYLVARVVAAAVGRHGRSLREIHIIRTAGHRYTVTTISGKEADGDA